LYSLTPIGQGDGRVEGLNSYLIRLANEHCVNVRTLVRHVLLPADAALRFTEQPGFNHQAAMTMNGLGPTAQVFAGTLNRLTARTDLAELTFLPFQSLFTAYGPGLMTKDRKWCAVCLSDAMARGDPVYQPLAWSLHLYEICTIHAKPLASTCPICRRRQPFVPRLPTVWHCAFCKSELAQNPASEEAEPDIDEPRRSIAQWASIAIENLLTVKAAGIDLRERFVTAIRASVERIGDGSIAKFYRQTGLPKDMFKRWLRCAEQPSLPQFLRFCRGVELMPSQLLGETNDGALDRNVSVTESTAPEFPELELPPLIGRSRKSHLSEPDRLHIQATLTGEMERREARDVSEIAGSLGVTRLAIRYWFPVDYKILAQRALDQRLANFEENRRISVALVDKYVTEFSPEGATVPKHVLAKHLRTDNVSLRNRAAAARLRIHQFVKNSPSEKLYTNLLADVHTSPYRAPDSVASSITPTDVARKPMQKNQ
jgi:hypothetical protein